MAKKKKRTSLQQDLYQLLLQEIEADERKKKRISKKPRRKKAKAPTVQKRKSKLRSKPKRNKSGARKVSKRAVQGYSKRVNVEKAKHFNKTPRLAIWKVTTFKRAIRITPLTTASALFKIIAPIVQRHFKALGKVDRNLYYVRLYYTYRLDNLKVESAYSIGVVKVASIENFLSHLRDIIESFLSMAEEYKIEGFTSIMLNGVETRGWVKV